MQYNQCFILQAECVASVTNCGLWLETAMVPTVNRGWHLFTNGNTRNLSANNFILYGD